MATIEEIKALLETYQTFSKEKHQILDEIFKYPMLRKSFEAIPTVLNYIALNYEEILTPEEEESAEFFAAGFEILRDSVRIIEEYLEDYKKLDELNKMENELNYLFLLNEFAAFYSAVNPEDVNDLMNEHLKKCYDYILDAMQNKKHCTEAELNEINEVIDKLDSKSSVKFQMINDTYEEISLDLKIPLME